jgi:uncharacterized protein YllA (UPF0747 family)
LLSDYVRSGEAWERRLKNTPLLLGRRLIEHLVEYNARLGAEKTLLAKLNLAQDGKARFVVTGQQPGVLGGPLLTLHKIETAIALAGHVEKTYALPCVPLYWMGADDIDFREIRGLFMVDANLSPLFAGIENSAHVAATPIGGVSVRAVRNVFESVEPFIDSFPYGPEVKNNVASALDAASDHGDATARLLVALTEGRIAVVDGREPEIRRQAGDLFRAFFDGEDEIKQRVTEQGEKLKAHGYHSQLSLGPDSGVFLLEDGRRKKITAEKRESARLRMKRSTDDFSPGVVLRNLVQDSVFDPIAVVLGPAEIAYRAQTVGIHELLSVPRPVVFPRMSGTFIPPPLEELLRSMPAPDIPALLVRPESFVKSVYDNVANKKVEKAAAEFRKTFQKSSSRYIEAVAGEIDRATLPKLQKQLGDVGRRLDRTLTSADETGKTAALSRWPFLAGIGEVVRRNQKPQDRSLSLLTPFLFGGQKAASSITAAAESYVTAALDGDTYHVVYSS